MNDSFVCDKKFSKEDFTHISVLVADYENCIFESCNFSECDLSGIRFIDCAFSDCNLSLAKLSGTVLMDAKFLRCKMLGLRFDDCNQLGLSLSLDGCALDHSSFVGVKLNGALIKDTRFYEAIFDGTDLSRATLDNCDFTRAAFDGANFHKADLRTSYGYSIDPAVNNISKAKFSLDGLPGLLEKYNIEIER